MFKSLGNFVKAAQTTLNSTINEVTEPVSEEERPEEHLGCLWEESENVNLCRGCVKDFAMPFIRRKHHCRRCGGTFCDECCPSPEIQISAKVRGSNSTNSHPPVRVCLGCKRGEVPGEHIQNLILSQMEIKSRKEVKNTDEFTQALKKVQKVVNKVANNLGVQVSDLPPSISVKLHYGKLYDDDRPLKKNKKPPNSGYFEFINKHTTLCAIKVLLPGGNKKFEIPRPSYLTVPPGESVYGEFDGDIETLELILLYNHPIKYKDDERLIYNTRDSHIHSSGDISKCAKVELFRDVAYFDIPCEHCNVLLKYKGKSKIIPRKGDALERVGIFNWSMNRKYAKGIIDYSTNVDTVHLDFSCGTS